MPSLLGKLPALPRATPLDKSVNLLVGIALYATAFGLAMVMLGPVVMDTATLHTLDNPFWSSVPAEAAPFKEWSHRAMGSLASGFAASVAVLAHVPLRRGETWAWWATAGLLTWWYALTWVSAFEAGAWGAAALDTGFYGMLMVPLWLVGQRMTEASEALEAGIRAEAAVVEQLEAGGLPQALRRRPEHRAS